MSDTDPNAAPLSVSPARLEAPYVGLRAYEEHERSLFFGRDQAAVRLEDEVLASPITILFAQSGAGKSSLLKAKLITSLRKRDAYVAYVDNWILAPLQAITDAVIASLPAKINLEPQLSLLEIARTVHRQAGKGLVLILDQFEQFFICHPEAVDALGRALGNLARRSPDTHIVLALREEYLGQLDALQPHLLSVTQSRYRLTQMSDAEAREALESPLERFGGEIEPGLVERLLQDLRGETTAAGLLEGIADTIGISLPFLQIVCEQLWKAANKKLTVDLYDTLGARKGIVQKYVDGAMQSLSPADRLDMAKILDLLAPKAGVKMAYPIDLLADKTHLAQAHVDALVQRLEDPSIRILRRREEGKVVELFHDAFSDVLRGFIDGEFEAERVAIAAATAEKERVRRLKRLAARYLPVAAIVVLLVIGKTYYDARQAQRDLYSALQNETCSKMLTAVREMRNQADRRPKLFERLSGVSPKTILERLHAGLSESSKVAASCPGTKIFVEEITGAPEVKISYNANGNTIIHDKAVLGIWKLLADQVWERQRRRVPTEVAVVADQGLNPGTFAIGVKGRIQVRRAIQPLKDKIGVLIHTQNDGSKSLEKELGTLRQMTNFEEVSLPLLERGMPYLGFASAWSTPLWKNAEERIALDDVDGVSLDILPGPEAWIAIESFRSVIEQPALYLSEDVTKALILERQKNAPCLVYAAIDRFDECSIEKETPECRKKGFRKLVPFVRESLVESARRGLRPGTLTQILDHIADSPVSESAPTKMAQWLLEDNGRARPPDPISLSLRRQKNWGCLPVETSPPTIYDWNFVNTLDYDERKPIRLRFGREIGEATGIDHLDPKVMHEIESIRYHLDNLFGVRLPGVSFNLEAWPEDRYRVDVIGRDLALGTTKDWHPMLAELRNAAQQTPMAWVTADETVDPWEFERIKRMYLYGWFEPRFSRNDIKLLLRGVLGSGEQTEPTSAPERTISRQLPWLLGSLVFWTHVCEKANDGGCLVERLRATQRERLKPSRVAGAPTEDIVQGIDALERDQPDAASSLFSRAIARNRATAESDFLRAYAPRADAYLKTWAGKLCKAPEPSRYASWGARNQTARDLVDDAVEVEKDDASKAHLHLCSLMYQMPTDSGSNDAETLRTFLADHEKERHFWSPEERFWLGYRFLEATTKQEAPNADDKKKSEELLDTALARDSALGAKADAALDALMSLCGQNKATSCYWSLVAIVESGHLKIGAGSYLDLAGNTYSSNSSNTDRQLQRLLKLLDLGKQNLAQITSPKQRESSGKWLELKRLEINLDLPTASSGDSAQLLETLDVMLRDVRSLPAKDAARTAFEPWAMSLKSSLLETLGRWAELDQVNRERSAQWKSGDKLLVIEVPSAMRTGDLVAATRALDKALAASNWTGENLLFMSALSHLLLNDEGYDSSGSRLLLAVDHMYRDYVRLMLWWRLTQHGQKDRAQRLLEERLLEIPLQTKVEERLANGDLGPWRESLVLYFLDPTEANRKQVFGPLVDKHVFDKDALSNAGESFSSFRCEAYFYDALRESATGNPADANDRCMRQLHAVLDEKCYRTYEYEMATYLTKHGSCTD